jgi:glycosyltransferase involved in cell wall biosynthesis
LFDIVTIVKNDEVGFDRTLTSLREQTFTNFRHIVIDGSDSKHKLNESLLLPGTCYRSGKDSGIYEAMNKSLRFVSSDSFVLFLNAGDILVNKDTLLNVSAKVSDSASIYYGGHIVSSTLRHVQARDYLNFSRGMPFSHQSVFCPATHLIDDQFNTHFRLAADFDLFYNLSRRSTRFINLDMAVSIIEVGGISDLLRKEVLNEWKTILGNNGSHFYLNYRLVVEHLKKLFTDFRH